MTAGSRDAHSGSTRPTTGPGHGRTNTILARRDSLDPRDRQVLCAVVCKCDAVPSIGLGGQRLKQQCVSGRLKLADALGDNQSPYKAEINYDMSKEPPAPIMDSGVVTRAHAYLPGWIQRYWPGGLGGYTPGIGSIRRPDVVIVNAPSLPPTQDNIKNVVEIKFPPDSINRKQTRAYARIAGDPAKVVNMKPSDCGCSADQPKQSSSAVSKSSSLTLQGLASPGLEEQLGSHLAPVPPPPSLPLP